MGAKGIATGSLATASLALPGAALAAPAGSGSPGEAPTAWPATVSAASLQGGR